MPEISKPAEMKPVAAAKPTNKDLLIDALLQNRISYANLVLLRRQVNANDLADIIQRIYDLNEKYILKLSNVEGLLRRLNAMKNSKRNGNFINRIKGGFRDKEQFPERKVILAEGDSWFNYPVILTDIIDRISMENDFALYSLASGGDWLLNMLTARNYVEELSLLHPDVFMISGGGNDLVGGSRIAAVIEPAGCDEWEKNDLVTRLLANADRRFIAINKADFMEGATHLSKDFFALLMFFHLQYYSLINGILQAEPKIHEGVVDEIKASKFKGIKIITQGYDYGIPSTDKSFGLNPLLWYVPFIRSFLGHGHWLKTPMMMRGITDPERQRKIVYAVIYIFNEMMIDTGIHFNSLVPGAVFHIDSRGSIPKNGWTDELHTRPVHFMETAKAFIRCIKNELPPTYGHVYVVKPVSHAKD